MMGTNISSNDMGATFGEDASVVPKFLFALLTNWILVWERQYELPCLIGVKG